MEEKLNAEMEKSRIIREKLMEQERTQEDVNNDFRDRCVPGLEPVLLEFLTEENNRIDNIMTNGVHDDDESSEQRVEKIRDWLKRGEFEALAKYIVRLDVANKEKRETMPIKDQVLYFVVLLNSYLFNDYVSFVEFSISFGAFFHVNIIGLFFLSQIAKRT